MSEEGKQNVKKYEKKISVIREKNFLENIFFWLSIIENTNKEILALSMLILKNVNFTILNTQLI